MKKILFSLCLSLLASQLFSIPAFAQNAQLKCTLSPLSPKSEPVELSVKSKSEYAGSRDALIVSWVGQTKRGELPQSLFACVYARDIAYRKDGDPSMHVYYNLLVSKGGCPSSKDARKPGKFVAQTESYWVNNPDAAGDWLLSGQTEDFIWRLHCEFKSN